MSRQRLAWMQRVASALIVAFWIAFWVGHKDLPREVVDYELSFVIPDLLWIAGLLLAASRWLTRDGLLGTVASAAAAGALVYLGLLDLAYNLRHAQYMGRASRGAVNLTMNAGCILFGLWSLFVLARLERHAGTEK